MKTSSYQYNGTSTEMQLGERRYELSDHLGNVQVVMSNRLAQADTGGSNAVDVFEGDVWSVMDYYPFGMLMRDRSANMEEMRLERSMFTDTVEVITWTKKTIDQPHPSTNAFQQPLDASNRKFKGKAWVSTTDQTANPDFADSTTQSSPIVFQYNGTSTEMHLAGLGYKSMRIEYNINATTIPALADNDSFVVELTAIFDGSYKATRVEIRDHSSNQLIKQQVITNPPNNFGTPVNIGFGVGSLDSVDIIIRAEFTNTTSYVPDLSYQGVSNWTNGIYLRNWHLTHYRRNSKEEVVSDTSDYFYRNKYAFGFGGHYRDDEIKGNGNSYSTHFRLYDSRLGRWWSIDPKLSANVSPFTAYSNNPMYYVDLLGDTIATFNQDGIFLGFGNLDEVGITGQIYDSDKREVTRSFVFNDLDGFDRKVLLNENKKDVNERESIILIRTDKQIKDQVEVSTGIFYNQEKSLKEGKLIRPVGKWLFALKYSKDWYNLKGEKKVGWFDFGRIVEGTGKNKEKFFLTDEGKAYNGQDFGNFMWGYGMTKIGFKRSTMKMGAHLNNMINGRGQNGGYRVGLLDSEADQRAISDGNAAATRDSQNEEKNE